ncbi:MAG TPA: zinc-dependent metalloprotease family protein [Thermoanaerobaculia bacterium]|nr:zinc-dependent metalloprotease family protein [Thermoanaerobaculia bacterium]
MTEEEIASQAGGVRALIPRAAQYVRLDIEAFQNAVAGAPLELTPGAADAAPVMTLPMPDGSFARFRVEESPIMEADLAARLRDVKTYRGEGIDIPEATARLDVTREGFHGFVLSPAGAVFIDPYSRGDRANYISYWHYDFERPVGTPPFHCGVDAQHASLQKLKSRATAARGSILRTYRLALACTGEYAAYYGGTVAGAQAGMVTTINRVNGIFEREVAIRLTMVDNTSICFTNAATDPYDNTQRGNDLQANQTTIDAKIGSGNYDIGHLFGTGEGGIVAAIGVVCTPLFKAKGLTGWSPPQGDPFDVQLVAHEIGHQFGAHHSLNATTPCKDARDGPSAYEPGSGSTIMSYAGFCGDQNLQEFSDPYFSGGSFDEIVAYTDSVGCASQTSTGNAPPSPTAPPPITIPASTPFYLTGSATDPNGDALTYCWEEHDLGTSSPPNTDDGNRPIFRSFNAVASPTRTFPRLPYLLANTTSVGESLPVTTRTMNFRLTARDNWTGVNWASTTVSVTNAAGPFVVTTPNTNVTWAAGSTRTVTWNVAGTNAAPVNCSLVKILLATDGGVSNNYTMLVSSTPNDGSEQVTVPGVTTAAARIRVECSTIPFFDVSDVNFAISAPPPVVAATATTSTNVAVSWAAIPGATSYEVYRRGSGGGYVLVGTAAGTSFDDNTAASNTAYLYAAKTVSSGGTSPLGSPDLATTVIFTDPTLSAQSTPVRVVHITQLRAAVNAVRALTNMGGYPFADPSLAAGDQAKGAHIINLRTALNEAFGALALSVPSYTDPTITIIRTPHVKELRDALQ